MGGSRRPARGHRRLRPIEIRLARETDLDIIPAIERSAAQAFQGRDVPPWLLTDASDADAWRPHLSAGTLWVAEADGQTIAFLAARAEGERLHIDELDVRRDDQGRGVGRRLLAVAADHARAHGFTALSLTTFRNVPWNAPFYASFGFREWDPDQAPASIRQKLNYEAAEGLTDRCAMRMDL